MTLGEASGTAKEKCRQQRMASSTADKQQQQQQPQQRLQLLLLQLLGLGAMPSADAPSAVAVFLS